MKWQQHSAAQCPAWGRATEVSVPPTSLCFSFHSSRLLFSSGLLSHESSRLFSSGTQCPFSEVGICGLRLFCTGAPHCLMVLSFSISPYKTLWGFNDDSQVAAYSLTCVLLLFLCLLICTSKAWASGLGLWKSPDLNAQLLAGRRHWRSSQWPSASEFLFLLVCGCLS